MLSLMKKHILFAALVLTSLIASAQGLVKTTEDTAFLMRRVYFPQMQIKLSISLLTNDFTASPKFHYSPRSLDSLQQLAADAPTQPDPLLSLSRAYYYYNELKKGDSLTKMAKDLYLENMMIHPADTHALRKMAEILTGEGDTDLAKAYYQELARVAPSASAGWSGLGMISMGQYQMDTAMYYLQKALSLEPDKLENYCQMANAAMLKAIYTLSEIHDTAVLDTLSYKRIINTDFLRSAIKKEPSNPAFPAMLDALHLTGIIYQAFIDNSGKTSGHGDTINWTLRDNVKTDLVQIRKRMEALTNGLYSDREFPYACLMLIEFLNNDPSASLNWFNKGIRYSPRSQNLYENITGICALSNRKADAFRMQLKLDSLQPGIPNFLMTANFYFLDKKWKDAESWTLKVLAIDPKNLFGLMGMAAIHTQQRQFGEAALYLSKASKVDARHSDILFLNAIHLVMQNSPQLAKAVLNELLPVYPGPEVKEVLERFFPE